MLQKIQFDLQTLQKRYESGKASFDKFGQWHAMFKKQDEVEALLNTDKVRKNRGGCLNEVLRDQKTTNNSANQYLRELQSACEQPDLEVTIDGVSTYEFALNLIQEREQQKENEKELKVSL